MAMNGRAVGGVVEAPVLEPARFGVVNRLTVQDDVDRWEGGVSFESLACAGVLETVGLCGGDPSVLVDGSGGERGVYAPAFGITAVDTCSSTFGSLARDRAAERAGVLLEVGTSKAVEFELMWGVAAAGDPSGVGRWLTGPGTVVVDDSGVCPKVAVGLLEDAWAGCGFGGGGFLHMTPGSVSTLRGVEVDDGVLFTKLGTPVVAGAGYASRPVGLDPGVWGGTWMFMTGRVLVWLGDPAVYPEDPGQAVTVATNDIRFKAERLAAAVFDGCCVFAVRVDIAKAC